MTYATLTVTYTVRATEGLAPVRWEIEVARIGKHIEVVMHRNGALWAECDPSGVREWIGYCTRSERARGRIVRAVNAAIQEIRA